MFDDQKTDQTENNNGVGVGSAPTMSIGGNPQQPVEESSAPAVVLPSDLTGVPAPANTNHQAQAQTQAQAPGNLEEIKRQALAQLSPLVSKLDQSPEDKHKTLLMMIQSADNEDLIPEAYENAQKITDDTVKAEALLSIVNEINYFSQKNAQAS